MRIALICIDKPDALQTRADNRAAHLAHIAATGVVEMAGCIVRCTDLIDGRGAFFEVLNAVSAWGELKVETKGRGK